MFRVKKLFGRTLSLRDCNALVGEIYAIIKGLNKLIGEEYLKYKHLSNSELCLSLLSKPKFKKQSQKR